MFRHDHHLPQLLDNAAYCRDEHFARERDVVFMPAWHAVATSSQLARDESYLTTHVLGRPLLLWRIKGELRAFLNVCPHRFCEVASCPSGTTQQLKCQYHGWEFDEDGDTRRIPDAKSFRPLKKGELGLTRFAVQECGQVVFVCLDPQPTSLDAFLGPGWDRIASLSSRDWIEVHRSEHVVDANWKVLVENALESYHIDMIHPKTFGRFPDEGQCEHELAAESTEFVTWSVATPPWHVRRGRRLHEQLSRSVWELRYRHLHCFPHVMIGHMHPYSWVHTVEPVSASKLRCRLYAFAMVGFRSSWSRELLSRLLRPRGDRLFRTVLAEDFSVMPALQRGLESQQHPRGGLISAREERIFSFHEWLIAQQSANTNAMSPAADDQATCVRPCESELGTP